jgi:hypothetical protein
MKRTRMDLSYFFLVFVLKQKYLKERKTCKDTERLEKRERKTETERERERERQKREKIHI